MGGAGFEAGIASHGRSCRYCGRRGCGDWRRGSRRRRRASDADRVGVADLDSSAGEDEGSDGVALCGARRAARGRAAVRGVSGGPVAGGRGARGGEGGARRGGGPALAGGGAGTAGSGGAGAVCLWLDCPAEFG